MALNEGKITQAGLRLLAKVTAGAKLELTKFEVGDGELGSRDPSLASGLIFGLYDYPIIRLVTTGNVATVTFNFSNQTVDTGFYWREVGLWARDPDLGEILFMYANSGSSAAEYIPPGGSSTILERQFNWRLVGSNAASITAQIDKSLMYASQDDLAAVAKQSLQVRDINPAWTRLDQMRDPGIYNIAQISVYSDRPITNSAGSSGAAKLVVKRDPKQTAEYDFFQTIEINGRSDMYLYAFQRRVRAAAVAGADDYTNPGPWIRLINAGGGTFTGSVQINGGLTIETVSLTANSKILANGGIDAPGGINTTSSMLVNGLANFTGSVQIGTGNSNAPAPSLALTLGDGDTGFNPGGDGIIYFYSNGAIAARLIDGRFEVSNSSGGYSKVGTNKYVLSSNNAKYQDLTERGWEPVGQGGLPGAITHKFIPPATGEIKITVDVYSTVQTGFYITPAIGDSVGNLTPLGTGLPSFGRESISSVGGVFVGYSNGAWVTLQLYYKIDTIAPIYLLGQPATTGNGARFSARNFRVYYDIIEQ